MPWAGNIAKTMTSNGNSSLLPAKCWPLLHVIAGISARFSNFAFVLFCYITNHLMTGPLGNSEFCFPRISMFSSTSSRETLSFSGSKIHSSPRDQSLSVNWQVIKCCYIARLSLNKMSTVIGWFLVTCPWSNSNVSRSGYNCTVVARTPSLFLCFLLYESLNI